MEEKEVELLNSQLFKRIIIDLKYSVTIIKSSKLWGIIIKKARVTRRSVFVENTDGHRSSPAPGRVLSGRLGRKVTSLFAYSVKIKY